MRLPVVKNESIECDIDGYTAEGAGVAHYQGLAVFVPGALKDERVRVKVIKTTTRYAVGRLERVLSASEHRVQPPCDVYAQCGGCALQHMDAQEQNLLKRQHIADCLQRIGGLADIPLPPVQAMEHPFRYRNKAAFPIAQIQQGNPSVGLFAARSHRLIPVTDCLLQHKEQARLGEAVQKWMRDYRIPAYDERMHRGCVSHLVTRHNHRGQWLVCIVCKTALPHAQELVDTLLATGCDVAGVVENRNEKRTNVILGRQERVLYGTDTLTQRIGGLDFEVSIQSFLQVNPTQTEALYNKALQMAQLNGRETVVDAYCGVGTMSLLFAQHAEHVYGVECVAPAVENAKRNAVINGIDNVSFQCALAEEVLPKWTRVHKPIDVLLLDPPRKGCDRMLLEAAIEAHIPRIVYVSCNPATMARDIALLVQGAYGVKQIEGVDMFPQTAHVETVALLERNGI